MSACWRLFLFTILLGAGLRPAEARPITLRCEGRYAYSVTFDTQTRRLSVNVEGMTRLLKVRRIKDDEDGLLIWAATPSFGGERDMLIRMGREKWVRTYFRNGSEETITCR